MGIVEQIHKLSEFKKVDNHTYERQGEKLKIGDADIDKILYVSRNDKFYAVTIFYNNPINYLTLKDILFNLYGKTDQTPGPRELVHYIWHGKNVNIEHDYDLQTNKGSIRYTYLPILKQASQDWDKKIKKAAGDL